MADAVIGAPVPLRLCVVDDDDPAGGGGTPPWLPVDDEDHDDREGEAWWVGEERAVWPLPLCGVCVASLPSACVVRLRR